MAEINVTATLSKAVLDKIDELKKEFEQHKAECKEKPPTCAAINCEREARNAVSGRLEQAYNGPACWVEVKLCDVCYQAMAQRSATVKGNIHLNTAAPASVWISEATV